MATSGSAEILETLGEGSFGVVYLARLSEGAIQRTVVLKVLKSNWAHREEILTRARDEAVLLARLNHDSIVRVEQLTEVDGRPAVIMEHVQGLSLDLVLRGNGPMPVAVAIGVAARVAGALDAAFNQIPPGETKPLRVVHRDIKPSNIIISISGSVKVLDFGTAHATFDAREAQTSAITLGSPLYMAPECFDNAEADPTVDMYALGATLYEMLAGVPLGKLSVNPRRHEEKLTRRLEQLRTPELVEGSPLTKAVRNLIERCLRYEPTRRPKAADMRRLCREFLKRMPRSDSSLDQFGEVVVEPLYRSREVKPPMPLDATMSMSGPLRLGGSSEVARPAAARSTPLPPTGPTPPLAPTPIQAPRPPPRPAPPPPPPPKPVAPPQTQAPAQEEGSGMGAIVGLGLVGLLAGLAVIAVIVIAARGANEDPPPPPPQAEQTPAKVETLPPPKEIKPRVEEIPEEPVEVEEPIEESIEEPEEKPPPADLKPPPADLKPPPADLKPPPADVSALNVPNSSSSRSVRVVSIPAGAEVVINGVRQRTPSSIDVLEGVSSAYVTFPDGSSTSCTVTIDASTNQLAFRQSGKEISCP